LSGLVGVGFIAFAVWDFLGVGTLGVVPGCFAALVGVGQSVQAVRSYRLSRAGSR
jgi:hypothetical protein